MGDYNNFADTPNAIIKEGEEITIKFLRHNDNTATIEWNIPKPANGCDPDTQAYNGILITVDTKPANYISTSPQNGKRYIGDPTVDPDMHAGDKLDTALVLAAFYNDKTTTSLMVTDLDPTKFYYVSGYAISNVGIYHREGVHAYSLPTGEDETAPIQYNSYQDVSILPIDNSKITLNTLTGLDKTKSYDFHIKVDEIDYHLPINGSESQSYGDMINSLNKQFKSITGSAALGICDVKNASPAYKAPLPPNANKYYVDNVNNKLYYFDGYQNTQDTCLFYDTDPSLHTQGKYWITSNNPSEIYMYETGGWTLQPFIKLGSDPTTPACGTLWYNGSEVYEFDGDHWCKLCLYVQKTNPSLAPTLDCNTYWYDTAHFILQKWNVDNQGWDEIVAIISKTDPNTLNTGAIWLNETDGKLYKYVGASWNIMDNVRYDEPNANNSIDYPAPLTYWLNPVTQILYKIDSALNFIEVEYTMYPTDPIERQSCDIWWNQSPSVDGLYVWDIVNNKWIQVINFLQQSNDPSLPPSLPTCVVWYNPTDGSLKYIVKNSCQQKDYIHFLFDPTDPPIGTVWLNTSTNLYYVWNGASWEQIFPMISVNDPYSLYMGYYWYDTLNDQLKEWNGTTWDILPYVTTNPIATLGQLWYNTASDELYQWNGSWVVAPPVVSVSLKYQVDNNDPYLNGRAYLFFLMNDPGCCHSIQIIPDAGSLLASVAQGVIYEEPKLGGESPASGPMYKQLGVGTDGTPDERRVLHETIRHMLGAMGVTVELQKPQINIAINNALLKFRKYSGYAVTRNFFFLDLKPNQQTYVLSNRCVGFNKITGIRALYRMQAGWIRTGLAGNELFGVAALQQLYTVGTFDMLSFALMSQYMKELEQLFASRIMHQWVESTRELRLYQRIVFPERVLVDATVERTEQDLLTNRATAMWLQSWAVAECKMMLGSIRGKYLNLPGPNGSTSLNGSDLMAQAQSEMAALIEELNDPAMGNYEDVGLAAHFTIG